MKPCVSRYNGDEFRDLYGSVDLRLPSYLNHGRCTIGRGVRFANKIVGTHGIEVRIGEIFPNVLSIVLTP